MKLAVFILTCGLGIVGAWAALTGHGTLGKACLAGLCIIFIFAGLMADREDKQ